MLVCDHEVTRGEYKTVIGSFPSEEDIYDTDDRTLSGDDALNGPANNVSWYDALVYCNKRSAAEGLTPCYSINGSTDTGTWGAVPTSKNTDWDAAACNFSANGYRLPTSAEWEWLARGEEKYTYPGSNSVGDVAWISANNNRKGLRVVKAKMPNAYGLYDMAGNVWEWCWDWHSDINTSTPASGAVSGDARTRRGGARDSGNSVNCEVSYKDGDDQSTRGGTYGLRVVRTAQ
ncbi:MAG: formylglycine-generating enzyme family protein [Treponema sp.]|nr:formylglycine-generating enzyme family protein [Treponema sp.]